MNEESLFAAALEKTTPTERQALLEEACAGDTTLRQRLDQLLAAHQRSCGIAHAPGRQQCKHYDADGNGVAGNDIASERGKNTDKTDLASHSNHGLQDACSRNSKDR